MYCSTLNNLSAQVELVQKLFVDFFRNSIVNECRNTCVDKDTVIMVTRYDTDISNNDSILSVLLNISTYTT